MLQIQAIKEAVWALMGMDQSGGKREVNFYKQNVERLQSDGMQSRMLQVWPKNQEHELIRT
jgi:hypothetical protein